LIGWGGPVENDIKKGRAYISLKRLYPGTTPQAALTPNLFLSAYRRILLRAEQSGRAVTNREEVRYREEPTEAFHPDDDIRALCRIICVYPVLSPASLADRDQ